MTGVHQTGKMIRQSFIDHSGATNKVFSQVFFRKLAGSKGSALGRAPQSSKSPLPTKDQEDRQNDPVDRFAVRNPIKGFPDDLPRKS